MTELAEEKLIAKSRRCDRRRTKRLLKRRERKRHWWWPEYGEKFVDSHPCRSEPKGLKFMYPSPQTVLPDFIFREQVREFENPYIPEPWEEHEPDWEYDQFDLGYDPYDDDDYDLSQYRPLPRETEEEWYQRQYFEDVENGLFDYEIEDCDFFTYGGVRYDGPRPEGL